jgi:hypothetical protein
MPDNKSQEEIGFNWDTIDRLLQLGIAVAIAAVAFSLSRDRILDLWPLSNSPIYYSKLLGVVLLIVIVSLLFRWILAVMGEIRMLRWYMSDRIRPQPIQSSVWTVLFSVFLGVMASFSHNITLCSAAFAVYSLGDVWGQKIRNSQLINAFANMDPDKCENSQKKNLNAIKRYYLERPQIERSVTLMFFSFVGLLFAEASCFQSETIAGAWLKCSAYAVVIVNITIGELVIFRWRRLRDEVLGQMWSF